MTNAELKTALLTESPVRCDGISYAKISAIIYRNNGGIASRAELMDNCGRSVTFVNGKDVEKE